ncbi:hypothetical protein SS50377_21927 [Spironucleus salmonicida]|uniref:Uncharacterized protein n=2 Tax=Spironucleus salmonicida TaxID=348837 RepID=A0A9P8S0N4_9EUKA|nr:hypothetical protein SS50377_21927 [Spironucleus salmonicida]
MTDLDPITFQLLIMRKSYLKGQNQLVQKMQPSFYQHIISLLSYPLSSQKIKQIVTQYVLTSRISISQAKTELLFYQQNFFSQNYVQQCLKLSQIARSSLPDTKSINSRLTTYIATLSQIKQQSQVQQEELSDQIRLKLLYQAHDSMKRSLEVLKQVKKVLPPLQKFEQALEDGDIEVAIMNYDQLLAFQDLRNISSLKARIPYLSEELEKRIRRSLLPKFTNFMPSHGISLQQTLNNIGIDVQSLIIYAFKNQIQELSSFTISSFFDFHFFASKAMKAILVTLWNARLFNVFLKKNELFDMFSIVFQPIFSFRSELKYEEISQFMRTISEIRLLFLVSEAFFETQLDTLKLKFTHLCTLIFCETICTELSMLAADDCNSIGSITSDFITLADQLSDIAQLAANFQNGSFSKAIACCFRKLHITFTPQCYWSLSEVEISIQNVMGTVCKISSVLGCSLGIVLAKIKSFAVDSIRTVFGIKYVDTLHDISDVMSRQTAKLKTHQTSRYTPTLQSFLRLPSQQILQLLKDSSASIDLLASLNLFTEAFRDTIASNKKLIITYEPYLQAFTQDASLPSKIAAFTTATCFDPRGIPDHADVFLHAFSNLTQTTVAAEGRRYLKQAMLHQVIEEIQNNPTSSLKLKKLHQKLLQYKILPIDDFLGFAAKCE